jgi:hypothetical protein
MSGRAVAVLAAALAAAGLAAARPSAAAELYPLGPGMRWTYRVEKDGATTESTVAAERGPVRGTYRVRPSSGGDGAVVAVEGDRVYSVVALPRGELRTLILDFSLEPGSSWEIPCDGTIVLESRSDVVSVPAGTFEGCVRVRTVIGCLGFVGPVVTWYAPGVGRVRSEQEGLEGAVIEELVGFEPLGAFTRGDANDDGRVNLADAIDILGWLFLGEAPPRCEESADADHDGAINITDPVALLGHLFLGGPPPPPPFPGCARLDLYAFACNAGAVCE